MSEVLIYTDGSCDKNPGGNGGFSSIIFIDEKPIFIAGYEPKFTNQRAEMMAVIQALSYLTQFTDIPRVTICTDSAYVANCFINGWYKKWMKNGWKNSQGEDVLNQDLWRRLLSLIDDYEEVKFIKVKGHADNIFNNKCDMMAKDIVSFKKIIDNEIRKRGV